MVHAHELRIGNYILLEEKHWHKISGDDIQALDDKDHHKGKRIMHGTPIPLSPELLKKCGFKNVQGDYWIKDNDLMLALDSVWWWTNSWEPDGEFGFSALSTYKEIEYLHQLQNLYFALTGSEIEVNL